MTHHMQPNEYLELALQWEEDPHERARLIEESFELLGQLGIDLAVEPEAA